MRTNLKPADEFAEFMARNNFHCQALRASISVRQCELNQQSGTMVCTTCTQERTVVAVAKPAKRHKGDNPNSPWRQNPEFIPRERRKPRAQSPEPRAQSPEPRAQSPEPSDQRPATSDQRPATSDQRPATSEIRAILQIMADRYGSVQAAAILRGE